MFAGVDCPIFYETAELILNGIVKKLNGRQRDRLEAIFSDPLNGNLEWSRIESLFRALGCQIVFGSGSSIRVASTSGASSAVGSR